MNVDEIIQWLSALPPLGVYAALWFTTYIENLFPPSPSDVVMLFIATLVGVGTIGLVPAIGVATLGSVLGFLTAFLIGRKYGRKLLESEKVPFLDKKALAKVDGWFAKYGYWVIVGNRFMAGTRAVVSFFAGMSKLELFRTIALCTISALAWNSIVILLGRFLGANWQEGTIYLKRYGQVVLIALAAIALYMGIRWYLRRRKAGKEASDAG